MITVYIASPYTKGDVAVNVRESFIVADILVKLGFAPFSPLFSHFWHFLSPKPYETWTMLDKEWVLRCDCLLRLDGESSGADAEVELAIENNIPVFYSIGELTAANKACGGFTAGRVKVKALRKRQTANAIVGRTCSTERCRK